ncbi:MAG: acyl-CoA dehydrogenase family protein [Candidatus Eremiobacteraeota bacterium]|nr:acyl-CoA dehydrogenase family protein [Candidatus Eremiobacteraeota bacterium]
MGDESYLSWPFFTDGHRAFAPALKAWLGGLPAGSHEDADDACRTWVRELGAAGWLTHCVPKPFGGLTWTLDVRTVCLARETLAYHDGLADFSFAMQGLGSAALTLFGSHELKGAYLPDVARGRKIAAFALSEKEAGSDVAAAKTSARRADDGYLLAGEKTWISNGGIADFYIVFARTGEHPTRGLSAFVVEATNPGLRVTERIQTMAPHPLATLRFSNCRVPPASLIGNEGDGFKIAMATLDLFRSTVGAAALGFARRAFDEAVQHVQTRQLFGAPLAALQLTQSKIATMATDIDASALLVYRAAYAKDQGAPRVTREAAMAKWFATESAQRTIDEAVQLFGGRGVRTGEIVERLYREIRALRIYEGASEVQQIIIARQVLGSA